MNYQQTFSGLRTKRDVLGSGALDLLLGRHVGLFLVVERWSDFLSWPKALKLNISRYLPSVP